MTKNEIYESVVRLTAELTQTHVAQKIFDAATNGDAVKAQTIIDIFPEFYPELYKKIVYFGKEFNKIVGDSEADKENFRIIHQSYEDMMYDLAQTKIIAQIAEATETGNPTRVQKVIDTFKEEHSILAEELINFQEAYTEYCDAQHTKYNGNIFGTKSDEENGVFIFDTNIIDALSFYVLTILANIADVYFFYDIEGSVGSFIKAIKKATNENFAEFATTYNLVDWVGKDEEYQTVGQLLVVALKGEF